jgi:hypothetical protein
MPRSRKHPLEWTNEEVLRRLFPPEVRKHLKAAVKEATEKAERKEKRNSSDASKKSSRKDSTP